MYTTSGGLRDEMAEDRRWDSPLLQPFLRTEEAARIIQVSPRTLKRHRVYRTGPKWSKVDRRIFYASGDLREWAERGAKRATSDPATVLPARPADEIALRSEPDSNPSASDLDVTQPDTIDNNDSQSAPPLTELRRGV
jgi:hypothetical protein